MNLVEALKTGYDIRRPIKKHTGNHGAGWISRELVIDTFTAGRKLSWYLYVHEEDVPLITETDLLADDWEVRETKEPLSGAY